MSFFLLATTSGGGDAEGGLHRLLRRHGFSIAYERTIAGRLLQIFDNPEASARTQIEHEDGTAVIALGHFAYDGGQGASALRAFDRDFAPDAPDWSKTQGHFTLLRVETDQVVVLCDGLGAHKIYCDAEQTVFSNSFLAVLATLDWPRIDPLGAYEYAWCGACYGRRSFVSGLSALPANTVLRAGSELSVSAHRPPTIPSEIDPEADFDAYATRNLAALREAVAGTVAGWDGRIRLSFSGGYDSRLLLGLLLEQGIHPELYVYGGEGDSDVRVARHVAEREGLACRRIDKTAADLPAPERYADTLEEALFLFDGWKNTGLFDNGADGADRHRRHTGGFLPLNGGLGEIYRNFFNLADRPYSAESLVDAFYRGYRREWATDAFEAEAYKADMAAAMRAQLGGSAGKRLTGQQAQMLYPLFRGRFWTAREAQINQRFGRMAFPYLEHRCIREAGGVPLAFKTLGRLQAAMIRRVSPRLAAYPSDYGFAFDQPPSLRYRLDDALSRLRPVRLRPYFAALKKRRKEQFPPELTAPYLSQVLDTQFPYTAPLFVHERIGDADTFNRVATMEYLAQRFGFAATEPSSGG